MLQTLRQNPRPNVYPIKSFNITSTTAPGIPSIPIKMLVKKIKSNMKIKTIPY